MAKTKVPEPWQLPSGAWHIQMQVNGETLYITRPTREETISEALAIKSGLKAASNTPGREKTVTQAIDSYIESRQNVLSPATIRGYRIIQRHRFHGVMHTKIGTISPQRWQAVVNAEARQCGAKTLKNAWGFMASVIHEATGQTVEVKLPQVIPNERPFLDRDEIRIFLQELRGDSVEIAALLALSSLRRSEIMALDWSDVDLEKGLIYVRGAVVQDEHNKMVRKRETKNVSSRRTVPIIAPLREALGEVSNKSGPVATTSLTRMYENINKICRRCGLPEVGVHGLRHSFASLSYDLRMPEKATMQIGGWSDPGTMRKIYTHISAKRAENYKSDFTAFFESLDKNLDKK